VIQTHASLTRASDASGPHAAGGHGVAEEGGAAGGEGNSDKLKRALNLWDVVAITIGTIIGSGIFASANRVLKQAGSVGHMLLVWVCRCARLTWGCYAS
jgi:amino acid permease